MHSCCDLNLNDKLGFKEITPSIINNDKYSTFGRNYAIGNCTSQEFENEINKFIFNKVTIFKNKHKH